MRKLSRDIEDIVILKLEHGFSTCMVAKELGLSQSYVQRMKTMYIQSLHCLPNVNQEC